MAISRPSRICFQARSASRTTSLADAYSPVAIACLIFGASQALPPHAVNGKVKVGGASGPTEPLRRPLRSAAWRAAVSARELPHRGARLCPEDGRRRPRQVASADAWDRT
jgi:hypothetical protein